MTPADIRKIEVDLFVEALRRRYGYDFGSYAKASLRRRVTGLAAAARCHRVLDLIPRLLDDESFLPEVIAHLSVRVSDLFRDPWVFAAVRREVLPFLASFPHFNVWVAGCAGGEEVYSLAIMLAEAGVLPRSQVYATDIDTTAIRAAEEGVYPANRLADFERNFREAGGTGTLSDYYLARYDYARIDDSLRSRLLFAEHNLVSDGVFCEAHLIMCRNVLIYFDRDLQARVLRLFHDSLVRGGFLCLGPRESLRAMEGDPLFEVVDRAAMILRKVSRRPEAR